ncbi:glycosyltransferase family 4 protein [Picosynechococcus sp. PCC 73109]|uniref:glycosyltransferase family 4 protein n=1 Tax=Picosynechococcus sp. PCC 73109 TaxID=374982 RepID=UPI001E57BAEB|nr:glycosyltransferase family 4 protein [Picosynechococcus sp. PCC 73109]
MIQATANSNSLNVAIALSKAGLLYELITTIAYNPDSQFAKLIDQLPFGISDWLTTELKRRTWITPKSGRIRVHPKQELLRLALNRSNLSNILKLDHRNLIDWVYADLDRHVGHHHLQGIGAVYAYEDEAATTFEQAKQKGIWCFYDLPTPYYKTSQHIQAEETERFPELKSAIPAIREPRGKLERKQREVELADHIFVASSMTERSLLDIGVAPEKITVIPYGAPVDYFQPQPKPDNTFRVIYAGRLSPAKGSHYLLQAWKDLKLPHAELMTVGSNMMPPDWFAPYQDLCRQVGSVSHVALNQYYSAADVLVLPSLVEGFGLVLTEAMACGIPVITTPNTAGPDIITDGVEGFIVPIRDPEALQEKIEWCYEHPEELAEMGRSARRKAEQLTWTRYQEQLSAKVMALLEPSTTR